MVECYSNRQCWRDRGMSWYRCHFCWMICIIKWVGFYARWRTRSARRITKRACWEIDKLIFLWKKRVWNQSISWYLEHITSAGLILTWTSGHRYGMKSNCETRNKLRPTDGACNTYQVSVVRRGWGFSSSKGLRTAHCQMQSSSGLMSEYSNREGDHGLLWRHNTAVGKTPDFL
jgi:hypothetical protein